MSNQFEDQKIVLTPHDLFFRKVMKNPLAAQEFIQTNKDGISRRDIVEELQKHLHPPAQSEIMTIAEAFVEEGRQEGFRSLLIKQLHCRFPNHVTNYHLHLIE